MKREEPEITQVSITAFGGKEVSHIEEVNVNERRSIGA